MRCCSLHHNCYSLRDCWTTKTGATDKQAVNRKYTKYAELSTAYEFQPVTVECHRPLSDTTVFLWWTWAAKLLTFWWAMHWKFSFSSAYWFNASIQFCTMKLFRSSTHKRVAIPKFLTVLTSSLTTGSSLQYRGYKNNKKLITRWKYPNVMCGISFYLLTYACICI